MNSVWTSQEYLALHNESDQDILEYIMIADCGDLHFFKCDAPEEESLDSNTISFPGYQSDHFSQ
jgi:hypothetical protein